VFSLAAVYREKNFLQAQTPGARDIDSAAAAIEHAGGKILRIRSRSGASV
jgi:hypothetical protein